MAIWTDASHRGDRLTLGVYNDETGDAIAEVIATMKTGNNTLYGEAKAVCLACELFPGTPIRTDNKELVNYTTGCKRPSVWLKPFILRGIDIEWVPRTENIVADWLSRSPQSVRLRLNPEEVSIPSPQRKYLKGRGSEDVEASKKERKATYRRQFLAAVTLENINQAEEWMMGWLIQDARDKCTFADKVEHWRELYRRAANMYKKEKDHNASLMKRISQLCNQ